MAIVDSDKLIDEVLFGDIHEVPLRVLDGKLSEELIDNSVDESEETQTRMAIAATAMKMASYDERPSETKSKKLVGKLYDLSVLHNQAADKIDDIKKSIRADLLDIDVLGFAELSPYHLMIDFERMASAKKRVVELARETDDAWLWYVIDIFNVIEMQGKKKGLRANTVADEDNE